MGEELTSEEQRVIEQCGTEPRFSSELLDVEKEGIFTCKKCGQELFSSSEKYDSGTGWPSFYDVIDDAVETGKDETGRMEVTCSSCGAHLGHVFNDGPEPTGKRYCINGIAMEFKEENNG